MTSKSRVTRSVELASFSKGAGLSSSRGPHPLPAPPATGRGSIPALADERKVVDHKSSEEKLAALKAFRRAKGLCFRCAEKWSRDHKCSAQVQLHVVQELLELFNMEDMEELLQEPTDQEQLFVAISQEAVSGKDGPRTMRLKGSIQGKNILVLVDSGSSHTFVSTSVAHSLCGATLLAQPIQVRVANGALLSCTTEISAAQWSVDGYTFCSTLKVLPLQHFDIILGMDWLEEFSPMKVHWKQKWMAVPYQGATAIIQGIRPAFHDELLVHVCSSMDGAGLTSELDPAVAAILGDFDVVFQPLFELPPARHCDHVIPLLPGAKPVHIRPYRYPPALKDEIEKQVETMLKLGIIQPSASAFSSPVLLVKKKNGLWRFCIDYRYLNALTVKSRFPILCSMN